MRTDGVKPHQNENFCCQSRFFREIFLKGIFEGKIAGALGR
jgi:hypothetical protein